MSGEFAKFRCPDCGRKYRVRSADAGRHGQCKRCGLIFDAPADGCADLADLSDDGLYNIVVPRNRLKKDKLRIAAFLVEAFGLDPRAVARRLSAPVVAVAKNIDAASAKKITVDLKNVGISPIVARVVVGERKPEYGLAPRTRSRKI